MFFNRQAINKVKEEVMKELEENNKKYKEELTKRLEKWSDDVRVTVKMIIKEEAGPIIKEMVDIYTKE